MVKYSSDPIGDRRATPAAARMLGYAGVAPFALTAAVMWLTSDPTSFATALKMLVAYGAIILSFLGGVRWGLAVGPLAGPDRNRELTLSVLPSLTAWVVFLPGPTLALGILVTGFIVQCLWDVMSAERGYLPRWYANLRVQLTGAVVVCLIAALVKLVMR